MKTRNSENFDALLSAAGFWRASAGKPVFYRQRANCIDRLSLSTDGRSGEVGVEAALWAPAFGRLASSALARAPFRIAAFVGEHGTMSTFAATWRPEDHDSLSKAINEVALPWLESVKDGAAVLKMLAVSAPEATAWQNAKNAQKRSNPIIFPDRLVVVPARACFYGITEMVAAAQGVLNQAGFAVVAYRGSDLPEEMRRLRWLRLLRRPNSEVAQEVLFCNDGLGQGVSVYVSAYLWKDVDALMIERPAAGYVVGDRVEARSYSCWHMTCEKDISEFAIHFEKRVIGAIERYLQNKSSVRELGACRAAELARMEKQNADLWNELDKLGFK